MIKAILSLVPLMVMFMGFPERAKYYFYFYCQLKNIFIFNNFFFKFVRSGDVVKYGGHRGPVFSIDPHPIHGSTDYSHLMLSASADWTVSLWSNKVCLI